MPRSSSGQDTALSRRRSRVRIPFGVREGLWCSPVALLAFTLQARVQIPQDPRRPTRAAIAHWRGAREVYRARLLIVARLTASRGFESPSLRCGRGDYWLCRTGLWPRRRPARLAGSIPVDHPTWTHGCLMPPEPPANTGGSEVPWVSVAQQEAMDGTQDRDRVGRRHQRRTG